MAGFSIFLNSVESGGEVLCATDELMNKWLFIHHLPIIHYYK
jgi:hypothetical protein